MILYQINYFNNLIKMKNNQLYAMYANPPCPSILPIPSEKLIRPLIKPNSQIRETV